MKPFERAQIARDCVRMVMEVGSQGDREAPLSKASAIFTWVEDKAQAPDAQIDTTGSPVEQGPKKERPSKK